MAPPIAIISKPESTAPIYQLLYNTRIYFAIYSNSVSELNDYNDCSEVSIII